MIRANSRDRYHHDGCATIIVSVLQMQLLIMLAVCVALKVYFIIVQIQTVVHRVRTILADVVLKDELHGGVAWLHCHVFFRVYGVIGLYSVVNEWLKHAMLDIQDRGVVVDLYSLIRKRGCWTQRQTYSARVLPVYALYNGNCNNFSLPVRFIQQPRWHQYFTVRFVSFPHFCTLLIYFCKYNSVI